MFDRMVCTIEEGTVMVSVGGNKKFVGEVDVSVVVVTEVEVPLTVGS